MHRELIRKNFFDLGKRLSHGDRSVTNKVIFNSTDIAYAQLAYCMLGSLLAEVLATEPDKTSEDKKI